MKTKLPYFILTVCAVIICTAAQGQISTQRLVKDICTVENSMSFSMRQITPTETGIYFMGSLDTNDVALWYSDGTTSGTKSIKKLGINGSSWNPTVIAYADSLLYFMIQDSTIRWKVWQSNGTENGTFPLKDKSGHDLYLPQNFFDVKFFGNSIYFIARGDNNIDSLKRFDLATRQFKPVSSQDLEHAEPRLLHRTNQGLVVFNINKHAKYEMTLVDKISHNPISLPIPDSVELISVSNLISAGEHVYFIAKQSNSREKSLYRYDIDHGRLHHYPSISKREGYIDPSFEHIIKGDSIIFIADGYNNEEIWMANPQSDSLTRICDIGASSWHGMRNLCTDSTSLFFTTGREYPENRVNFWKVNFNTLQLDTLNPFSQDSIHISNRRFDVIGNRLYFTGYRDDVGTEMFYYDLETNRSTLVEDVSPDKLNSQLSIIAVVGNYIFTSSYDQIYGNELGLVENLFSPTFTRLTTTGQIPGNATPRYLTVSGDNLYFSADNIINGTQLFSTSLRTESTQPIGLQTEHIYGYYPSYFTPVNGAMYFKYYLYTSSTYVIGRITDKGELTTVSMPNAYSNIFYLKGYRDLLFVESYEYDTRLYKLYVIKNSSNEFIFINESEYSFKISEAAVIENTLYYSNQNILYEVDLKTLKVKRSEIVSPNVAVYNPIISNGQKLFFTAYNTTQPYGTEFWMSDGTRANTKMVADLTEGPSSSKISGVTVFGNNVAFTRLLDNSLLELWVYNPLTERLEMIKSNNTINFHPTEQESEFLFITIPNIFGGQNLWIYNGATMKIDLIHSFLETGTTVGKYPFYLDGWCYYINTSTTSESTLYKTDGTNQGTSAFAVWQQTDKINNPTDLLAANQKLFYSAYSTEFGRELFVMDLPNNSVTKENPIKIVPNPVADNVQIFADGRISGDQTIVKVFNTSGQNVFESSSTANPIEFNVGHLLQGVYVVRLSSGLSAKFIEWRQI